MYFSAEINWKAQKNRTPQRGARLYQEKLPLHQTD